MKTNNSSYKVVVRGNISKRTLKVINPAGVVAIGFTSNFGKSVSFKQL